MEPPVAPAAMSVAPFAESFCAAALVRSAKLNSKATANLATARRFTSFLYHSLREDTNRRGLAGLAEPQAHDPSTQAPALAGGSRSGFLPTGVVEGATGLPVGLHV